VVAGALFSGTDSVRNIKDRLETFFATLVGDAPSPCCAANQVLAKHHEPLIAIVINDIWQEGRSRPHTLPERFSTPAQAVHIGLMSNGRMLADAWASEGTVLRSLEKSIQVAQKELTVEQARTVDSIEVFLGHSFRIIEPEQYPTDLKTNRHRGIRGLEIKMGAATRMYDPLYFIRFNASNGQLVREFALNQHTTLETVLEHATFRTFDGEQIIVTISKRPKAELLQRGNDYVAVDTVSARALRKARSLALDWVINALAIDGHPSQSYDPAFRQFNRDDDLGNDWASAKTLNEATQYSDRQDIWHLSERTMALLRVSNGHALPTKTADIETALAALAAHHNRPAFSALEADLNARLATQPSDTLTNEQVFAAADTLVTSQRLDARTDYKDLMGTFTAPTGLSETPRSVATARHVSQLSKAFNMARAQGDANRENHYRLAIIQGLRSLLQVQFDQDIEMFFMPDGLKKNVRGGLRHTVYDNRINAEAVIESIAAFTAALNAFTPADYEMPSPD
jgi:hypothetical protein